MFISREAAKREMVECKKDFGGVWHLLEIKTEKTGIKYDYEKDNNLTDKTRMLVIETI